MARRESEGFFEAGDVIGVPTPGAAISHQLLVCVCVCDVYMCVHVCVCVYVRVGVSVCVLRSSHSNACTNIHI